MYSYLDFHLFLYSIIYHYYSIFHHLLIIHSMVLIHSIIILILHEQEVSFYYSYSSSQVFIYLTIKLLIHSIIIYFNSIITYHSLISHNSLLIIIPNHLHFIYLIFLIPILFIIIFHFIMIFHSLDYLTIHYLQIIHSPLLIFHLIFIHPPYFIIIHSITTKRPLQIILLNYVYLIQLFELILLSFNLIINLSYLYEIITIFIFISIYFPIFILSLNFGPCLLYNRLYCLLNQIFNLNHPFGLLIIINFIIFQELILLSRQIHLTFKNLFHRLYYQDLIDQLFFILSILVIVIKIISNLQHFQLNYPHPLHPYLNHL